ncbi:hypothetical protein BOX15_Mlig007031g2 [Macrostomum lignano]|uniref:Ion transport domain-containing protein n=2 Tax=Macrostomum lignano TaxID=282301 RepID=A0A267E9J7_9PLAT|nr:hypothetical protein BOX15_Mlig007031g2 [Macrostomum lignano]
MNFHNSAYKPDSEISENNKGNEDALKSADDQQRASFQNVADIVTYIEYWKRVATHRRQLTKDDKSKQLGSEKDNADAVSSLLQQDEHSDNGAAEDAKGARRRFERGVSGRDLADREERRNLNRSLLQYFISVSTPGSDDYSDSLDSQFVQSLLERGASLNTRDRYGQTVLHEVAKNWNPAVMELMIRCGGDPNAGDFLGRTPLHVAAASNYPDMCRLLVRRGANPEALTSNGQTPLFLAAKTDSVKSLLALMQLGCQFHRVYDSRGRTPLYAAAELDRSETAAILIERGADAFVKDNSGQIAFVPMVEKMPGLAKEALSQLHYKYRIDRNQTFDLFRLFPIEVEERDGPDGPVRVNPENIDVPYYSAIRAITNTKNYNVVNTPILGKFLDEEWNNFGRKRAILQVLLQLITILMWTVFAVIKEWTQRYLYVLPEEGYRIFILIAAMGLTAYNIGDEIFEYYQERRRHLRWQEWKSQRLEEDLQFCHPQCPDERRYLEEQLAAVQDTSVSYFNDAWNYLDWLCYIILLAALVSHFVDVWYPGGAGSLIAARWHVRILAINIVMLWVRLLKYIKPFEFFGPFIVMLGMITSDLVKFFLLYLEFFIPFACVFWNILGGEQNLREVDVVQSGTLNNYSNYNLTKVGVQHFDTVSNMAFMLFRLTLVDEYDYESMIAIDQVTSQILLGAWFAVSAILFLNLFIAQLSETFKSVYDNAKATASMQKAITLNGYYDHMMLRSRIAFHRHLKLNCNPLTAPYDDDVTEQDSGEELRKATLQIRDTLDELKTKFDRVYAEQVEAGADSDDNDGSGGGRRVSLTNALASLADGERTAGTTATMAKKAKEANEKAFAEVHNRISQLESGMRTELESIKSMLKDVAIVVSSSGGSGGDGDTRRGSRRSKRSRRRDSTAAAGGGGGSGITQVEPAFPTAGDD